MTNQSLRRTFREADLDWRRHSYFLLACGVGLALGLASLWLTPRPVLFGVLGLFALWIIARRPELGILAVVVVTCNIIDPGTLPLLSFGSFSFHLTDIIVLFLLGLVVVRAIVTPAELVRTPLDFLLLWFYLAVFLAAVLALAQPVFGVSWVLRWLRPLTYYLIFFAVTNLVKNRRQLSVLLGGLLLIAIMASLLMIVQVMDPSLLFIKTRMQELSTAGLQFEGVQRTYLEADRLIYPMFLITICSLILGGKWLRPMVGFAASAILAVGLLLTFQRNYWLTALAMVGLLAVQVSWPDRFRILRWVAVCGVLLAVFLNLPETSAGRYVTAASDRLTRGMQLGTLAEDQSTQWRVIETGYALSSIVQHPLLGVGLGNFYRPPEQYDMGNPPYGMRYYIHNAYLWVWIDTGLVGFIPFICIFALAVGRGFSRWRKIGDFQLRSFALGITLGILGQCVTNVVAPDLIQSWSLVIFPILLGINELIFRWERTGASPRGIVC